MLATVYEQYIFLLDKIKSKITIKPNIWVGFFCSKKAFHQLQHTHNTPLSLRVNIAHIFFGLNRSLIQSLYMSMVFHSQWWIIFGNVKISQEIIIFWDKSYNAVYSRTSRVAGSMDRTHWALNQVVICMVGKFHCPIPLLLQ